MHSVAASIVRLNKTGLYSIYVTRGFTRYENGHGLENEFVFMSKDGLQLGWLPVDDYLVYWFMFGSGLLKVLCLALSLLVLFSWNMLRKQAIKHYGK